MANLTIGAHDPVGARGPERVYPYARGDLSLDDRPVVGVRELHELLPGR